MWVALRNLCVILCLVVLCIAFRIYLLNRPPVDMVKLKMLATGASRATVLEQLGRPTSDGDKYWRYTRRLSKYVVVIHFDAKGDYASHDFDED